MQTRWLIKTDEETHVKLQNGKRETLFKRKTILDGQFQGRDL